MNVHVLDESSLTELWTYRGETDGSVTPPDRNRMTVTCFRAFVASRGGGEVRVELRRAVNGRAAAAPLYVWPLQATAGAGIEFRWTPEARPILLGPEHALVWSTTPPVPMDVEIELELSAPRVEPLVAEAEKALEG